MTENEAREFLGRFSLDRIGYASGKEVDTERFNYFTEVLMTAMQALTEIQQYRAIGTVEECREARERQRVKDIIHNTDGGVDEDWLCPSCGRFCSPYTKHCQHCGQAVKVGDNL
jgi:hypothetical protein